MMGDSRPPYRTPCGNVTAMNSPTSRPKPAPILKTGINMPEGTGIVEAIMENMN